MRMLGLDAVHWAATRRAFRYTKRGIKINWAFFERHDVFSDTPIARLYPQLDDRFANAKFILTLRDPDTWLESFDAQFGSRRLAPFVRRLHRDLYGAETYDAAVYRAAFQRHLDQVRMRFAGRPSKLLEFNITAGDGWAPLCDFLGLEQPDQPFPWRFSRAELLRERSPQLVGPARLLRPIVRRSRALASMLNRTLST
jgi:hypothetical protein